MPELTTREAAVQWLESHGWYAAIRDWSFGESIMAGCGAQTPTGSDGEPIFIDSIAEPLIIYKHMFCIYPDQGAWSAAELAGAGKPARHYSSLTEAVAHTASLLAALASDEGQQSNV